MTVRTMLTTLLPRTDFVGLLPFSAREADYTGERLFRLMTIIAVFLFCTLLFVWSRLQVTHQEYLLSEAIKEKQTLEEEYLQLRERLAKVKSPERLVKEAKSLGLVYPGKDQLIFVREM